MNQKSALRCNKSAAQAHQRVTRAGEKEKVVIKRGTVKVSEGERGIERVEPRRLSRAKPNFFFLLDFSLDFDFDALGSLFAMYLSCRSISLFGGRET